MFKNMKVGTKIIGGFFISLVLTAVIGGISIYSIDGLGEEVHHLATLEIPETSAVVKTEATMWKTHVLSYEFDIKVDEESKKEWFDEREKVIQAVEEIIPISMALNHPDTLKTADEIKKKIDEYRKIGEEYAGLAMKNKQARKEMEQNMGMIRQQVSDYLRGQDEKTQQSISSQNWDDVVSRFPKLKLGNQAILDAALAEELMTDYTKEQTSETLNAFFIKFDEFMNFSQEAFSLSKSADDMRRRDLVAEHGKKYRSLAEQWSASQKKQGDLLKQSDALAMGIIGLASGAAREADQEAYDFGVELDHHAHSVNRFLMGLLIGAVALGSVLAFFITRGITRPLNRVIIGLNEGADQVASASGQVSSASQSMASGASEQAAAIEEISSSMEEMASMTKRNAENAGNADGLMKEANQVVTTANAAMGRLTESMGEISKASEETSKIIKTIDEIAFQTNLLALNAAVEAARAGEAGAGFAVVADEVRNLAMRAANAAKDTAQLIEGTIKKVNDGSDLVSSTNEAFKKVAASTGKVGVQVAEIAHGSREQSIGIDQVNMAITEMDKVVQQNAANAEESASASEEMSAQAEQLKEYVDELVVLVRGKNNEAPKSPMVHNLHHPMKAVAFKSSKPKGGANTKKTILTHKTKEIRPDQVIPFDEDNSFKDF